VVAVDRRATVCVASATLLRCHPERRRAISILSPKRLAELESKDL
jgi:hypothetical protein